MKKHIDPPGARSADFWGGGPYDPRYNPRAPHAHDQPGWEQPVRAKRSLMGAGLNAQLSDVDEIVFGRDMDDSANAVKDVTACAHFAGSYGMTTRQHHAALETHNGKARGEISPPQPLMASALSWPDQRLVPLAASGGSGALPGFAPFRR